MGDARGIQSDELRPGVVRTHMSGHVSAAVARSALSEFRSLLQGLRSPVWIIDVTEISGFDASTVGVGAQWYEEFSAARGRRVLFVATHRGAQTVARALGWGARMKVDHYPSLDTAIRDLP